MNETPQPVVGVMIVDDHDLYRALAAEVVAAAQGFEVVASAESRAQALQCMDACHDEVQLVLMDVNIGDEDGVRLTHELTSSDPNPPDVVLVTALAAEDLPRTARTCGARGYLPKVELSPLTLKLVRDGVYDWADASTTSRTRRRP